jgi:hypothetical protein
VIETGRWDIHVVSLFRIWWHRAVMTLIQNEIAAAVGQQPSPDHYGDQTSLILRGTSRGDVSHIITSLKGKLVETYRDLR